VTTAAKNREFIKEMLSLRAAWRGSCRETDGNELTPVGGVWESQAGKIFQAERVFSGNRVWSYPANNVARCQK
jgi:hypothetical protein